MFEEFSHKYDITGGEKVNIVQAYADDLLLLANSKENMDILIE
jgi:hypothetical protein